jgi:hypothetical protein
MVQVFFNDTVLAALVILRIEVFWGLTLCRWFMEVKTTWLF